MRLIAFQEFLTNEIVFINPEFIKVIRPYKQCKRDDVYKVSIVDELDLLLILPETIFQETEEDFQ